MLHNQESHHGAHAPFVHGDLLHQFKKAGVLKQEPAHHHNTHHHDNVIDFPELSIQHILRTENHLGHAIDKAHEIDFAHLNKTAQQDDHLENEIFHYSQKETGREQHGGSADANVATDTGHMKIGILDPDAFKKREKKEAIRTLIHLQELDEQRAAMDAFYQQIVQFEERLQKLDEKLKHLNHEFHDMKDAMEFLEHGGDLNSNSPRAIRAKRALSAAASRHGVAEGMYKHADGTYDHDAAKQIIMQEQQSTIKKIITVQEDRLITQQNLMQAHDARYKAAEDALNNPETSNQDAEELRDIQNNSTQATQDLEIKTEETSADIERMKALMESNQSKMQALYAPANKQDLVTSPQNQSADQRTASFAAGEDGDNVNVIKASFNTVSDPTSAANKLKTQTELQKQGSPEVQNTQHSNTINKMAA